MSGIKKIVNWNSRSILEDIGLLVLLLGSLPVKIQERFIVERTVFLALVMVVFVAFGVYGVWKKRFLLRDLWYIGVLELQVAYNLSYPYLSVDAQRTLGLMAIGIGCWAVYAVSYYGLQDEYMTGDGKKYRFSWPILTQVLTVSMLATSLGY